MSCSELLGEVADGESLSLKQACLFNLGAFDAVSNTFVRASKIILLRIIFLSLSDRLRYHNERRIERIQIMWKCPMTIGYFDCALMLTHVHINASSYFMRRSGKEPWSKTCAARRATLRHPYVFELYA